MVRVVAANEDDIDRVLEIELDSISPPWPHGALLSEIYREDSFFAVARDAGILGFVILRWAADDGELLQIAVDKPVRHLGVGDLLMTAAINYAYKQSLSSVHLEVRESNANAIALYKKHGFKTVRLRRDYYTDPIEDAVVMVKGLLRQR